MVSSQRCPPFSFLSRDQSGQSEYSRHTFDTDSGGSLTLLSFCSFNLAER